MAAEQPQQQEVQLTQFRNDLIKLCLPNSQELVDIKSIESHIADYAMNVRKYCNWSDIKLWIDATTEDGKNDSSKKNAIKNFIINHPECLSTDWRVIAACLKYRYEQQQQPPAPAPAQVQVQVNINN